MTNEEQNFVELCDEEGNVTKCNPINMINILRLQNNMS